MSMTREQMLNYIENPALLNEKTLGELKEIIDEFPYFQTAHLLYTRNLLNENNFRFANELKICAIHATDRSVLYHLLNPEQSRKVKGEIELDILTGSKEDGSVIELTENFPVEGETRPSKASDRKIRQEEVHSKMLNFEPGETVYRLEESENDSGKSLAQLVNDINEAAKEQKIVKGALQRGDLIDRFIKENPTFSSRGINTSENSYAIADHDDTANENDEFITETLAKIYIKQGLYQKAVDAFHRLILKYPEKSVYFARQIEEVKNLLNK